MFFSFNCILRYCIFRTMSSEPTSSNWREKPIVLPLRMTGSRYLSSVSLELCHPTLIYVRSTKKSRFIRERLPDLGRRYEKPFSVFHTTYIVLFLFFFSFLSKYHLFVVQNQKIFRLIKSS